MLHKTGTLLVVTLLAACGGGQQDASMPEGMGLPDQDVRTILSIDRSFQDAVKDGDWELLRGIYAEDAVTMPSGSPTVEGIDNIIAYYQAMNGGEGLAEFKTNTDVIHGDATIGYHRGTWTAGTGDDMVSGKFLWVLRRMPSGEWRIVADMYNTDS